MTDRPTADLFLPHVGKAFRPHGQHHVLTLVSVDTRQPPGWEQAKFAFFALLLRGPAGDVLPEGHYNFNVEDGPEIDFYIMPVHTPSRDYQDYQAIFA
jgi:hypothetical protein